MAFYCRLTYSISTGLSYRFDEIGKVASAKSVPVPETIDDAQSLCKSWQSIPSFDAMAIDGLMTYADGSNVGFWAIAPTIQQYEELFGAFLGVFALAVVFKLVYDQILNKR